MSKRKIRVHHEAETAKVISYLESVVQGLKAGALCVENDGETVTLKPTNPLEMELEVRQKRDKESLTLTIQWATEYVLNNGVDNFRISATQNGTVPSGAAVETK